MPEAVQILHGILHQIYCSTVIKSLPQRLLQIMLNIS